MEKRQEVTVGNPMAVAGVTLIPIVQVLLNYWHGKSRTSFYSVKQPVAVIVVSPSAKRAFRITGEEVSIDQLAEEVPGIKNIKEIYPQPSSDGKRL